MTQLFTNNAASELAGTLTSAATSLTLKAGEGAKFPSPTAGDFFLLTLYQKSGSVETNHEIVKCTARSGDVLTVVRAQEGTTARAFAAADPAELRLTAGALNALSAPAEAMLDLGTASGTVTLNLALARTFKVVLNGAATFAISSPAGGSVQEEFWLDVRAAGNAVTWPASVQFAGVIPPVLSNTGRELIRFSSNQNGTLWAAAPIVRNFDLQLPAYADWRIKIVTASPGTYTGFTDLQLRATAGGADLTSPGNTITATATYSGQPAEFAIDANSGTAWLYVSITASPQYLTWSLASASSAVELVLSARTTPEYPQAFTVQASSDAGATWIDIKSFTGVAPATTTTTFTLL